MPPILPPGLLPFLFSLLKGKEPLDQLTERLS
jgi:hypothetical protein